MVLSPMFQGMVVMGYEPDTYYSVGNVDLYTALVIPQGEISADNAAQ